MRSWIMSPSTIEKIKKTALALFAVNGYEATTMNQIAEHVGITKPAIYVYFKGKEELFLSVLRELTLRYRNFITQVTDETQKMGIQEKLYYIFEQYILYFSRNVEVSAFWNRVLLFPPPALKERIFLELSQMESGFSTQLRSIFEEGIHQGKLRPYSVKDMEISYRCLREGLLMAFLINPNLEKEKIRRVWNNYWFGISMDQ